MKKLLSIILTLVLAVGVLVGCGQATNIRMA